MTSLNLTEAEAAARSALVYGVHYRIHVDLTRSEERFPAETVVTFSTREPGTTFIDLSTDVAPIVVLDGALLDTSGYVAERGIELPELAAGEHRLEVKADIPFSRTGQGLHRAVDHADGRPYFYTQFETADAKRMFACFDQPDIKATYDLSVVARPEWKVILNEVAEVTHDGDRAVHRTQIGYPLSTYLVAVCAGEYAEFRDVWRGQLTHHPETPEGQPTDMEVPLGLYCRASLAEHLDVDRLMTETKQGFDFYHRHFGYAYPFGKYDQIFVPEFNAGAMENAGCVTIRDEYVFRSKETHYKYERRAETILHELAHMWFGDLVTMRWWGDLWLNESFATFSAAISQSEETAYDTAWVTFANVEKAWAYGQDQLPTTHPISTAADDIETVEQNFDGITYAKGASVLKQLQAYVGRDAFFAGVRAHFAQHAFGNATFDDLLAALEQASGRDLSFWADQWLKTTGINRLEVEAEVSEDGTYSRLDIVQSEQPLRTHRAAVGVYDLRDGRVTRISRAELDLTGERTAVDELVGTPAGRLILPNDDDLTYALFSLHPDEIDFVIANIAAFDDPMARTLCWSAAWQMTRDGKLRARDFIELVARGAEYETELAVTERVLNQAATAWRRFADPAWAESSTVLVDALLRGAQSADPDVAIIFERVLAEVELTDAAADHLRSLLDSDDADQRWRALIALVARGELSEEDIAAHADRDHSSTGVLQALKARAARPDPEVKAKVWQRLCAPGLSNLETRYLLEGLVAPGAKPHLEQFSESYYDTVRGVWDALPPESARTVVADTFPRWDLTEEGLARGQRFLDTDLPAALRRLLAEEVDAQARALRLRAVDAGATVETMR
ncbi:aminopeptidase N [Corynebacterium uterequi]|nr:aminopeptidase N [Corynebacterium uterequi]